jgi:hypothetical protein
VHFPRAEKIVLMSDNLNTHKPAALYEAFRNWSKISSRFHVHAGTAR